MNDYQQQAQQFIARSETDWHAYLLAYVPDAIQEEAGEMCGVFAKAERKQSAVSLDRLRSEVGDLLWNIAAVCTAVGISYAAITPKAVVPAVTGARLRARVNRRCAVIADGLAMNAECLGKGEAERFKPHYFAVLLANLLADVDALLKEHDLTRAECEQQNIKDLTEKLEKVAA